ncbi:ATP-dependent Clp protease adapter ClpS [Comamonas piscis]
MATKPVVPPTPKLPATPKTPEDGGGALVLERIAQRVEPPKMYQVVMLNDDFTPMEFVIEVLQHFFGKSREAATQIMLKIHLDGKGVCGVYSHEIAETKVALVMDAANGAGHPLQAVSEPVE